MSMSPSQDLRPTLDQKWVYSPQTMISSFLRHKLDSFVEFCSDKMMPVARKDDFQLLSCWQLRSIFLYSASSSFFLSCLHVIIIIFLTVPLSALVSFFVLASLSTLPLCCFHESFTGRSLWPHVAAGRCLEMSRPTLDLMDLLLFIHQCQVLR